MGQPSQPGSTNESLRLFLLITKHRMLDHYVPKLTACLTAADRDMLWLREKGHANTIGGIALHLMEHVRRSIRKLTAPGAPGLGGFEDYFPDSELEVDELIRLMLDTFSGWGAAMDRLLEAENQELAAAPPDMHHLYHLVEHCSYHVGQIVDRVQRLSGQSFRFVQNGVNEKSLRERIDSAIRAKL